LTADDPVKRQVEHESAQFVYVGQYGCNPGQPHKFEGALFPVELANGIASMSNYPSARILERFIEQAVRV
jgi:hypothetical protein